jgi:cytochrome c oxidase assembly factor CtaG
MVGLVAHAGEAGTPEWLLPAAAVAVAAALFARAFVTLRRRGRADLAPWSRAALFAAALALALAALVSPLDRLAEEELLSAHMLQHVLIGDAAPALALTALRGPLLFFLLPAGALAPLARAAALRRLLRFVSRPGVAYGLWAANLAIWHVPRLYDAALAHRGIHDLEHFCWVTTGVLVWTVLVDPARHETLTRAQRIVLAALLFATGQLLTDALVFSFSLLYPAYSGAHGLSAVTDQQLAGVVMMVEQLLTLGTLAVVLLRPRVRRTRRPALAA